MKAVKKMLMGIAIILFGISIVLGGAGAAELIGIGWLISLTGLFLAFVGYHFTEDDTHTN